MYSVINKSNAIKNPTSVKAQTYYQQNVLKVSKVKADTQFFVRGHKPQRIVFYKLIEFIVKF